MTITKIEPVSKTRFQIFLDGKPAFCLYRGELSRYHLVPGAFLEEEAYQKICEEVLVKRAKLRAMHLLNQMGRTEQQLKDKLIRGGYPEEVAEAALCYVKSFGYVNDLEYARSSREMQAALREKGVSREIIEEAMEECCDGDAAQEAIRELLRKRRYDPDTASPEETRKTLAYLMRKGFRYDDVRQVIQVSEWNA